MTKKEQTELLTGLSKVRDTVRAAAETLRHQLTALRTDDRLKRRLTPAGQREQAAELRQAAIDRHRPAVARARLAVESVAGMTPEAYRRAWMGGARLEIPAQPTAYASEVETRREQRETAILNELRMARLSRTLERATAAELAERAKRAVASGTEAGVAELELIRQELASPTRTDLAHHRVTIEQCIEAVAVPASDAEAAELAQMVVAVAGAIERGFHEIEHAQAAVDEDRFADVSRKMDVIKEIGVEKFVGSVRERAQEEQRQVQQAGADILRASVLNELKTEGEA